MKLYWIWANVQSYVSTIFLNTGTLSWNENPAWRIRPSAIASLRKSVMPSRERVAVLLEFLGRQTTVELPNEALIREMDERRLVL